MTALLVDLSHHNAEPDWPALRAGGQSGVVLKATEGVGYTDPVFASWRAAAHAAGLAVGVYHFARLGPAAAEAGYFKQVIGALAPGEFVALDLEVAVAGVDPVAWTGQWIDALAGLGVPVRLLYLNRSELGGYAWAPIVARGVLLWLADYDGSQAPVASGAWPSLALKQFSDAATVPGEAGTVDEDVLFGSLDLLTGSSFMTMPVVTLSQQTINAISDAWANRFIGGTATSPEAAWQELKQAGEGNAAAVAALATQVGAIATQVGELVKVLGAVQAALGALPAQTAAALPAMACQGNPKAVLSVIGQAASAAAQTAP